jgi:3-oxoacyl-(acyl-carrier-protein) synthase
MSAVFIHGCGAVSPAGWGVEPLRDAVAAGASLPPKSLARPGWNKPLNVLQVPTPAARPSFLAHARLRRSSPISQYTVAAALEALGEDIAKIQNGSLRVGIIVCAMSGCVNYSRRFYDETLRDPATASPLVFPETVFNAPSSHLASFLGTTALNYTLVGDPGTFLQGVALAAQWLVREALDGCVVVGAEEMDWLTADAYRLFSREVVLSDGAGALYLSRKPSAVTVDAVTDSHPFHDRHSQIRAALQMRSQLPAGDRRDVAIFSSNGVAKLDRPETKAWNSWPGRCIAPKSVLGEGLMAASAWQTVVAVDLIARSQCANAFVSVVGCNQQAIGARFSAHGQ